jgi:peroxiredoxin
MRYIYFLLLITTIISCKQNAADDKKQGAAVSNTSYVIAGSVEGADSSEMVVLKYLGTDKSDTTYTQAKTFLFKGTAAEPLMAIVYLPNSLNEQSRPLSFMVENAEIHIEGHKDSLHKAKVVGGLANSDYNSLKKILKSYDDKIEELTREAEKAQTSSDIATLQNLQVQYSQTAHDKQLAIKQYATENSKSVAGAYFVYQDLTTDYDKKSLDSIYNAFDPSVANSTYGKKIKRLLEISRQTAIGQPAPELNLKDANGKPVTLASLKGKYVLLDFWASWCGPCRQENPNVVSAYKKFKQKGFTVLGVSLDEDRAAWQQAIQKDGLTWAHVSDLKGWQSSAAEQYGIQAIPANFLLDKNGIIIDRDLRDTALTSKLEEVLAK